MSPLQKQSGLALVETMIAILILAIGVVGMIGLQAKATSAMADAQARTESTLAAEELLGMMWNDQNNMIDYINGGAAYTNWVNKLTSKVPGANVAVNVIPAVTAGGITQQQVTITITWRRKQHDDLSTHRVVAYLEPAQ